MQQLNNRRFSRASSADPEHSLAHPCYKPIDVMMPLIRTWSAPGDLVLDPFHGGGGVLAAVLQAGQQRRYVGIERLAQWHSHVCDLMNQSTQL